MSDLIAVAYQDRETAEQVRKERDLYRGRAGAL